jgi:hypothetical protein
MFLVAFTYLARGERQVFVDAAALTFDEYMELLGRLGALDSEGSIEDLTLLFTNAISTGAELTAVLDEDEDLAEFEAAILRRAGLPLPAARAKRGPVVGIEGDAAHGPCGGTC